MGSSPITSWQINGETMETVTVFIFLGSRITEDDDGSHEIKNACSLEERLWQTRQHVKGRDITLLTKVRLVKAMIFLVVMYGVRAGS